MVVLLAALFALALVLLLWLWAIGPQLPQADFSAFHKYDYAHRGLHNREKGVPENSLMAFELAARGGFGMELDVQLTQDGQIVIYLSDGDGVGVDYDSISASCKADGAPVYPTACSEAGAYISFALPDQEILITIPDKNGNYRVVSLAASE